MSNIVTAVRVRPFSEKEKKEQAYNVIHMNGNETKIELQNKLNTFNFDHSFWSHDGYTTNSSGYTESSSSNYIDQKLLFDKIGKPLVENAWKGYNCSLFAYGQTGSGKTYSIMGYNENKGLVPTICESLFDGISKAAPALKEGEKYQVQMGMLEIYNEKLRDLINPSNKESLVLRENVDRGFYAPNQLMVSVDSYANVLQKIQSGNKLRTIASTNMNETSSRAHTVVSLQFMQIIIDKNNRSTTKTSFINLVDLAGSEQVKKSLAEGARFVEALNINKSLSTLGLCLNSLSTKQTHVPYRDSMLTKLLMNALGGNSKTVLLAAISPSHTNFEESLSTLRFAERAKKVVTKAKINVSDTDKIIRYLKEENIKLLQMITELQEKRSSNEMTQDDSKLIEELNDQWKRNQTDVMAMTQSYKEQLQQAKDELEKNKKVEKEKAKQLKQIPHMYNLNEDPALNKVLVYMFDKPVTIVGNSKAQNVSSIKEGIDLDFNGINIMAKHAAIRVDKASKRTFIAPFENAAVFINGVRISTESELKHFDRILLGSALYFFHFDPLDNKNGTNSVTEPTIDEARQEVTAKSEEFKDLHDKRLIEELSTVYPLIMEANVMAKEMKKSVVYSLLIFQGNLPGYNSYPETQVGVRVLVTKKRMEYFYGIEEFKDIRHCMVNLYNDFKSGESAIDDESVDFDPFIPRETDLSCVGFSYMYLEPVKFTVETSNELPVINYQGHPVGHIQCTITSCDSSWTPLEITDREIAIGSKLFVKISIDEIHLKKSLFQKIYYRFRFYDKTFKSPMCDVIDEIVQFNEVHRVEGLLVDSGVQKFLNEMMPVEVWGCYDGSSSRILTSANLASRSSIGTPVEHDNLAIQTFLSDLRKMAERRQKKGHSSLKISDIAKIAPKGYDSPENQGGSISCVIQ